jgi:hypothetical protein
MSMEQCPLPCLQYGSRMKMEIKEMVFLSSCLIGWKEKGKE